MKISPAYKVREKIELLDRRARRKALRVAGVLKGARRKGGGLR